MRFNMFMYVYFWRVVFVNLYLEERIHSESAQSRVCGGRDGRLVFAFSCLRTALGTVSEETCSVLPSFLIRLWVKETYLLQGSEFSHLILQSGHRCYITLPHDQFPNWGKSACFNSPVCLEPSEIYPLNLVLIILGK